MNDLHFNFLDETSKQITAQTIRDMNADILCMQEVENADILAKFNEQLLGLWFSVEYESHEYFLHHFVVLLLFLSISCAQR